MNTNTKPKRTVRIYACGGLGLNIGRMVENLGNSDDIAMARIHVSYIDTSKSNVKTQLNDDKTYFFKDMDGAGQQREKHHAKIVASVPAILDKFPPQDFNIFLSGTDGGSGSVLGPELMFELMRRDKNVVAITAASNDSLTRIQNTIKTVRSYNGIAQVREKPAVVAYFENSERTPRDAVDEAIFKLIGALCVLFSGQNIELDSQDLANFLNFTALKSVNQKPRLVQLSLIEGMDELKNIGKPISVATLATETSGTSLSALPAFQAVGYLPDGADDLLKTNAPVHFVTSTGCFNRVVTDLERILVQNNNDAQAEGDDDMDALSSDSTTANGIDL